jgi:hypothetical protein
MVKGRECRVKVKIVFLIIPFLSPFTLHPLPVFAAEELVSLQAKFLRGDYDQVVQETRRMDRQGGDLSDGALYLWGVCALKLDYLEEGRTALQRLVSQYPGSGWRAQAQELLQQGAFYYCVQVGSFSSEQNARKLAGEIKKRGYESEVREGILGGKTFYRVRVGRFGSRSEAEGELNRLKQDGFPGRIFP